MIRKLNEISSPESLRGMTAPELEALAPEIRKLIIETTSKNGGHLAPSLGAVELTLALYSVFHLPKDKVIWDVGHQAYTHKILTGRREVFPTLRKWQGITGFPSRAESDYDAFGVGHASTSISAALGMAIARDLMGRGEHIIAVIGDGALTGGLAFEALNHAGDLKKNLIVILNDNGMSIDFNVGAMSEYLSRIRVAPEYARAKEDIKTLLMSIPRIGGTVYKTAEYIKESVKSALIPGGIFSEMGFNYIGPIDGHNIRLMKDVFDEARMMTGPILIHVRTKKGCGYVPAELEPDKFHGVGSFDIETGAVKKSDAPPSFSKVFGDALMELAEKNQSVAAITAAMPSGTGLKGFSKKFPGRFFDVGIAEEHAITLAAGMAAAGLRPVAAIYSTFAQRAYDQMMHDVCLQNLPVILALDRAGLVGDDGPTHHGAFDLSYLRTMPNITIFVPKDESELRDMLFTAVNLGTPAAIRYPRGAGYGAELHEFQKIPIGRAEIIGENTGEVSLLALGSMVEEAKEVQKLLSAQEIKSAVVNMRFVKPLDYEIIREMAKTKKLIVTMEENVLTGGFGSAVAEFLADEGLCVPLIRFGIPDKFIPHGARGNLLEFCGLTPEQIADRITAKIRGLTAHDGR